MIKFNFQIKGIEEIQERLKPEKFQKAVIRSLDRAAKAGRQEALNRIRERYNIKESDLRREITTDIHPSKLEATITAKGRPISLSLFKPKQIIESINLKSKALYSRLVKAKAGRMAKGVTVEIVKGHRKPVRGGFIPGFKTGTSIFKREGKARLPIKKLSTIGSPAMFGSRRIVEAVKRKIVEVWKKNIEHELAEGWKHR
jgi:hypothetical protein